MEGGGGDDDVRRPGVKRRKQHQKRFLSLDIVLEIAARSDPVTLVRCAATCRDARRHIADDQSFRRRLRLRHAADGRFVPSLLRGHLMMIGRYHGSMLSVIEMYLVDVTGPGTGATARLLSAAEGFPPSPDDDFTMWHIPLAWRDGLFLVRTKTDRPQGRRDELRVCDPATGCSQTLPPGPTFPKDAEKCWQPYVLLGAGAGAGGGIRPFQVLKTNLVMSGYHPYLEFRTFSSESGTWGTYTKICSAHFHGSSLLRAGRPLVVGGAVHWLCLTDAASYVLRLDISTALERFTVTTLPASFPRPNDEVWIDYLLATATAGGSLMVLVADSEKISAWVQTTATQPTARWKPRPEVVVEYEALRRFRHVAWPGSFLVRLHWFAERSGFVLVYGGFTYGYFWLDLRSKKIVRCFSDPNLNTSSGTVFAPYEMDLSSWVPTFTSPV